PGKNLGAYGDAGMVTSNDAGFVARVRQLANHGGGANKYDNVVLGTNSRLDALQAAVLRVKLRHLDAWNRERRQRVFAYARALAGGALAPALSGAAARDGGAHRGPPPVAEARRPASGLDRSRGSPHNGERCRRLPRRCIEPAGHNAAPGAGDPRRRLRHTASDP